MDCGVLLWPGPGKGAMADSYSSKLQLGDGWACRQKEDPPAAVAQPWTALPAEYADHLYGHETLGPPAHTGPPLVHAEGSDEPYTLQWFLEIEHLRHRRHGRWLPS